MAKKQSKLKLWLYRIVMIFAAAVFLYSAYQIYDIWNQNHMIRSEQNEVLSMLKVDSGSKKVPLDIDWDQMQQKNPDIVGFIVIPDTEVFYPIVYRKNDNDYYLTHTAFLGQSMNGAIFIDGRGEGDINTNPHTVLYGHNIQGSKLMFSKLDSFFNKEFFEAHPDIYIFTPQQNYKAAIFSAYATDVQHDDIYSYMYTTHAQVNRYMQTATQKSVHQRAISHDENTNYITLSTCSFNGPGGAEKVDENRYLVHAALIPWDGVYEIEIDK